MLKSWSVDELEELKSRYTRVDTLEVTFEVEEFDKVTHVKSLKS